MTDFSSGYAVLDVIKQASDVEEARLANIIAQQGGQIVRLTDAVSALQDEVERLEDLLDPTTPPPPPTLIQMKPNTTFAFGGETWKAQSDIDRTDAMLRNSDGTYLEFNVYPGDTSNLDGNANPPCNRAELECAKKWGNGVTITEDFEITITGDRSSSWCVTQWHEVSADGSDYGTLPGPSVWMNMNGTKIGFGVAWDGGKKSDFPTFTFAKGTPFKVRRQVKFGPTGDGRLIVSINGAQLFDWTGKIGSAKKSSVHYPKVGFYGPEASGCVKVVYRNYSVG